MTTNAADFAAKIAPRVKILLAEGVAIDDAIRQAGEEYLDLLAELAAGETDRAKAYREIVFEQTYRALRPAA